MVASVKLGLPEPVRLSDKGEIQSKVLPKIKQDSVPPKQAEK